MKKSKIIRHLKKMEWSGTVRGQETGMGFDNGHDYAGCPVCGGLQDEVFEFNSSAWGHRRKCWLNRAIREK